MEFFTLLGLLVAAAFIITVFVFLHVICLNRVPLYKWLVLSAVDLFGIIRLIFAVRSWSIGDLGRAYRFSIKVKEARWSYPISTRIILSEVNRRGLTVSALKEQ